MAKTYLNAVTTNLRYLQKIVPQMIQTAMMQKQLEKELETQFFTQWPKLNTKEHGADIAAFSQAIHSLNKNISRDDLFRQVGAAIMAKFAIPAGVPAAPAALAKAAPFVPAGIGTVVHSQPVVEGSPFDGLGEHFDDE